MYVGVDEVEEAERRPLHLDQSANLAMGGVDMHWKFE